MINNVKNTPKEIFKKTNFNNSNSPKYDDMIVFCHLTWQFVYQRPQHIISRLSSTMKILFIEESLHQDTKSWDVTVKKIQTHFKKNFIN